MKWTGIGVGVALVAFLATGAAANELPVAVSPASSEGVALVADECARFSWSGVERARWYELVVHEVDASGRELGKEVLRQRVPGGALSWTPSLDLCLAAGGRYAWAVRARGGKAGGAWSEPALFEVLSEPSVEEVRQAVEVLRRHLGIKTGQLSDTERETSVQADDNVPASDPKERDLEKDLLAPQPFTLLPGPSAVAGEETTATGTAFGLVGLTHSIDGGFGVYGENVAKGNFGYLGGHDYGVLGRGKTGGGYFKDEDQTGWSIVGFMNEGISAHGNEQGGFFQDDNSTGRAHVAWGEKGIEATGGTMGGYFKDRETSPRAEAKLAYTKEGTAARYGIWARGSVAGGYFEDGDGGSGYAEIGVSDSGVSGRGDQYGVSGRAESATGRGGYFSNSAGGTALQSAGTTVIGSVSGSPGNLFVVSGEGTATGGVAGFDEVVARFQQTDTAKHSAVSIDSADLGGLADPGQDAILYFSKGGNALWDIRVDDSDFAPTVYEPPDPLGGSCNPGYLDTLEVRYRHGSEQAVAMQLRPLARPAEQSPPECSVSGYLDAFELLVAHQLLPGLDAQYYAGEPWGPYRWRDVYSTNLLISTSDARLKSDVEALGYGLSEVLELRPVSYRWTKEPGGRRRLGFLAQEVEPMIPEAVWRGDAPGTTWGMSSTTLVPVLARAIQEQQEKIDELGRVLTSLEEVSP